MAIKEIETCCVADPYCIAPANLEPQRSARGKCFRCGQAVCSRCSAIRDYSHYGKVRLCHNCIAETYGEKVVINRLQRMKP